MQNYQENEICTTELNLVEVLHRQMKPRLDIDLLSQHTWVRKLKVLSKICHVFLSCNSDTAPNTVLNEDYQES